MPTLPHSFIAILDAFASLFSKPTFRHIQVLLAGAILTPGRRTVTNALRAMGLKHDKHFQNYHRVLNRACWSSRKTARILFDLLVRAFVPEGPIVIGIDETLERRQGSKIKAKGIYRDAARSRKEFFVKSSGLRWISLMLLAPIPWAGRVWALPFLTVLAPSERYDGERGRRHKTLAKWAGQIVTQVRRWLPKRALVVVADGGYSVLTLLARCVRFSCPVTMVTRLRLDAALYEALPECNSEQNGKQVVMGRPRKKGKRLPTLQRILENTETLWQNVTLSQWYGQRNRAVEVLSETCIWYHSGMPPVPVRWVLIRDPKNRFPSQALVCTDLSAEPVQILSWFVQRWQLETTFQEVRTHLGGETQRQWNDLAILRTTPVLLGLFSLVTLLADQQSMAQKLTIRQASWYVKARPTFSDALACVRKSFWSEPTFWRGGAEAHIAKLSPPFRESLVGNPLLRHVKMDKV